MKILFYGDSITDMNRNREAADGDVFSYGVGYPNFIVGELSYLQPTEYTFVNRGVSGDRIVDLYARVKRDVWNQDPDVLSILIGVNDVWHEVIDGNGVDLPRWERIYRMLIEDTLARLPNVRLMICEPFVLEGSATSGEKYRRFLEVREYAKVAKKLADEYHASFVPLQEKFDEVASKYGGERYLFDGVHPTAAGAKLIATEWLKIFHKIY